MPPRLSLLMIAKDEAPTIGLVLGDVAQICDQMVVVDTGSSDATVQIAQNLGAEIHSFEWIDDFSTARNFALSKCTGDWVLWLDADDRVPLQSCTAIRNILLDVNLRSDVDSVGLPYHYKYAFGDAGVPTETFMRHRLIRNHIGIEWQNAVHEHLVIPYERMLMTTEAWVEHHPTVEQLTRKEGRNLRILEASVNRGDTSGWTLSYLAMELLIAGRTEEAASTFGRALASDLDADRRYDVLCAYSDCVSALGRNDDRVAILMEAITLESSRAEAFIRLGLVYFEREQWERAAPYFAAATAIDLPNSGFGITNAAAYSYIPWDYLSVCASQLGHYQDAIAFTEKALPGNPDRERLLANLKFNIESLA